MPERPDYSSSESGIPEVGLLAHEVLAALTVPVIVDDPGDVEAVGQALLDAWRERAPLFGIDLQMDHGEGVWVYTVGITVGMALKDFEEDRPIISRQGIARAGREDDPWTAYWQAFTRASWLWGLRARVATEADHTLRALLEESR